MADEDLDLDQLDSEIENKNKTEKRIKDLSEKVRLTAEDRDEQKRLREEQDTKVSGLEKERDFLNSFGDQIGKHPEASAFKDKIKEKVLKGYSVEDATTAVLVAEGKYTTPSVPQAPAPTIENFGGGSATTQHQTGGEKTLGQMSRDEKRAKLMEAEQRGDIGVN